MDKKYKSKYHYSLEYKTTKVSLSSYEDKNYIFLSSFCTPEKDQRSGQGTRLLNVLTRWARRYNLDLRLSVGPFQNRPLCKDSLISFYQRFGFQIVPGTEDWDPPYMEYKGERKCVKR